MLITPYNTIIKNSVYVVVCIIILFLSISPTHKIFAKDSQATVIVPGTPVITVIGSNPVTLTAGVTYIDAGAIARDVSGNTIAVTIVFNNVNTTVAGTYLVEYEAVDGMENIATTTRIVNIVSALTGKRKTQSIDTSPDGLGGDTESTDYTELDTEVQKDNTGSEFLVSENVITFLPINFCFNKNLSLNASDLDVKYLQIFLNNYGFLLAQNGAGSSGEETINFVERTKNSLERFQEANLDPLDLKSEIGFFGNITRQKVNEILGCEIVPEIVTIKNEKGIVTTTKEVFQRTEKKIGNVDLQKEKSTTTQIFKNKIENTTTSISKTLKQKISSIPRIIINHISEIYNDVWSFVKNFFEKLMFILGL